MFHSLTVHRTETMLHELLFAIAFLAMVGAPGYVAALSNRDKRDCLWFCRGSLRLRLNRVVCRRLTGFRIMWRAWHLTSARLRWRTRQANASPSSRRATLLGCVPRAREP